MAAENETLGATSRVDWVDAAKGVCIVLVVMMHTTLGLGEATGQEGWMHEIVAFSKPFRMPDFFLVSGLFLARVIDRDWRGYIDRRVVHFLYFYLLWLLIQSGLKAGSVSDGTLIGFAGHLAVALVEPFGTLWFVYMLAVFSVVTKLLRGMDARLVLIAAALLEALPIATGHVVIDEFAARYVYFVVGYLFAPQIFTLARHAADRWGLTLLGLAAWALVNGSLALNASPDGAPYAEWPGISLALGLAGAAAVVTFAALLTRASLAAPLAYCGRHSIAIYLAFFIPMAASRALALKLGLVGEGGWLDVGTAAALLTLVAIVVPLAVERIVRPTPLRFLFERPGFARLPPREPSALAPA